MSIDMDSVDFNVPKPIAGGDDAEYHVSRNFTYFTRVVRNVGRMTAAYVRLKKKKEWGIEPEFIQLEHAFQTFLAELPADLTVTFPADGSAPWLPSPFLGNLHAYYYLTLILFHRPQLSFLDPTIHEAEWKNHMLICYNSAKAICRLQEATLNSFGLTGLQCMLRGFSFCVYAGLSCVVLHLVSFSYIYPVGEKYIDFGFGVLTVNTGSDCFSGSRFPHRCSRVLCPTYENNGKSHGSVANARAGEANQRCSRSLFGRYPETFCAKTIIPIW